MIMGIKYVDNHAHLNLPEFDGDYLDVANRAEEAGVRIINVGVDKHTSKKAVDIAEQTSCLAIVGQHPTDTGDEFDYEYFRTLAQNPKVIGIGECGLDFFHVLEADKIESQKKLFKDQIKLALEIGKPLMLHIRDKGTGDTYWDALEILKSEYVPHNPRQMGNVHFFAGTLEIAEEFVALGFTISFTGAITYGTNYIDIIKNIPLTSILSETDCPFVAPVPHRGKRNEPAYVVEVVKKIAEIRGISVDEVGEQLLKNSKKLFGI